MILQKNGGQVGKMFSHYPTKVDPPKADKILENISGEERFKKLMERVPIGAS